MRIAVCDNDQYDRERLHQIITEYPEPIDITRYSSGWELLGAYEMGARHDLIFLGIKIEDQDCFSTAVVLRETYTRDRPIIIYVAETAKRAHRAFGVADWYLSKPVSREDIHGFIDRALIVMIPKMIELLTTQGTMIMRLIDIYYIEADNDHLVLHSVHGDYIVRATLGEMMTKLPNSMFFRTHRSYIVNLSQIDRYDNTFAYFGADVKAYISRRRKDGFAEALIAFVNNSERTIP